MGILIKEKCGIQLREINSAYLSLLQVLPLPYVFSSFFHIGIANSLMTWDFEAMFFSLSKFIIFQKFHKNISVACTQASALCISHWFLFTGITFSWAASVLNPINKFPHLLFRFDFYSFTILAPDLKEFSTILNASNLYVVCYFGQDFVLKWPFFWKYM